VFLRGLRRVIVFFYGTAFVLVVKDMESICRLWVVDLDVACVLLVA
jgi:acetyl esterase/lipase